MAYNPATGEWETEDASVSSRLTGLVSKESPLIKQARTQGLQTANSRGLLNSSMAVGASQNAAYSAALPVASQEATQVHQANLSKQEFGQQRTLQDKDIENQRYLQSQDIGSRQSMQGRDIDQQRYLQQQDIAMRERVSGLDRAAQERIANMNLGASERAAASNLAASFENSYSTIVANIMNNAELPAANRQQYLDHAARVRDSNLALVEQLYGLELEWNAAPQTPATPALPGTPYPGYPGFPGFPL